MFERQAIFSLSFTHKCSLPILECDSGWYEFNYGAGTKCLKNMGDSRLDKAADLCQQYDAELPMPKNARELADLNTAILLYDQSPEDIYWFSLDGNDSDMDKIWRDSNGEQIQYLPWLTSKHPRNIQNKFLFLQYARLFDFDHTRWISGYRDLPGTVYFINSEGQKPIKSRLNDFHGLNILSSQSMLLNLISISRHDSF